jgi:hypothetical protein
VSQTLSNDAFISYSHRADREPAAAAEKGPERLAKPLFAMRAVEVFPDVSNLPASSGLGPAHTGTSQERTNMLSERYTESRNPDGEKALSSHFI